MGRTLGWLLVWLGPLTAQAAPEGEAGREAEMFGAAQGADVPVAEAADVEAPSGAEAAPGRRDEGATEPDRAGFMQSGHGEGGLSLAERVAERNDFLAIGGRFYLRYEYGLK
ncbi:MAG TPA: hypothetical protein VFH51_10215, partial [Myxococcota bacterium]|nr:hypothetical protein [Myxococcota bacterium]